MIGFVEVVFETMGLINEALIHLLHLCLCRGMTLVRMTSGNGRSNAVLVTRKYGTLS
jgi:hypothetical protein